MTEEQKRQFMLNVILRRRRLRYKNQNNFGGGGFSLISAVVENSAKDTLVLTFSKAATITTAGWSISTDGAALSISSVSDSGTTTPEFTLSRDLTNGEVVTISYDPSTGSTTDPDGTELSTVTDFSVTNNVEASGYTFSNTQELVIDASGEAVTINTDTLFPSDGSGTDEAVSYELWYETPSDVGGQMSPLILEDDNGPALLGFIQYDAATQKTKLQLRTDVSNRIEKVANDTIARNSLNHIIVTYDGSESTAGIKIYLNGTESSSYSTVGSTGTYTGLPSLSGTFQNNIGASNNPGAFGKGQYQVFRQFDQVLSSGEVTTLYNSGTPVGLTVSLQGKCVQENLFNGNANADNIGTNGTTVGGATYTAV